MSTTYTTVLTRKGQTTIPVELRVSLGLREGQRLIWWEEDGGLRAIEAREYVRRMSEFFRSKADPSKPALTIEEIKETSAEGWTERYRRWNAEG